VFISYAQNFEDVMLWRALRHVVRGSYVDVGAQDPVVDSVSMAFYEQGWRGVHVEPVPAYAALLRRARPDERVVEAALAASAGRLTLHEFAGTGLSTGDRDVALTHVAAGFAMREIEVECTTLEQVLAPYAGNDVHWMKIDVEGLEHEALSGWGAGVNPWIVVVESTLPRTQAQSHLRWESLLLARGYVFVWFDGLNRFYVSRQHDELRGAFDHGPAVFDDFALSGTATASFCALVNDRAEASRRDAASAAARADVAVTAMELAATRARTLESRLADSQAHASALQAHIDTMTDTLSWRITAPLRWLRGVARRSSVGEGAGMARRALALAKRSGAYSRLAPLVRERYPRLWARSKQWLVAGDSAVAVRSTVGHDPQRATLGASMPHDAEPPLDSLAEAGSVSVDELASLLEREITRQRER